MTKKNMRRNFFIKPGIQGQFIFKTFLLVLFCCILYAAIFATFSTDSMTITYTDSNLSLGKTPIILFKEMLMAQGAFIVSGGVGVVLFALIISHHFAGPLHKLEMSVKRMEAGDHSILISLRPGDKGHELADSINRYNGKMSEDIGELQRSTTQLGKVLASIQADGDSVPAHVAEAEQLVDQIRIKLQSYTIRA